MQYRLRTLMILMAIAPPMLALAWFNSSLAIPVALCWLFLEALLIAEMAILGKE
jgi:hypothetical protein